MSDKEVREASETLKLWDFLPSRNVWSPDLISRGPCVRTALRLGIGAVAALVICATTAFAQTVSVSGIVTDPDRAMVTGADVTLTNLQSGAELKTKTDGEGEFQFTGVRPEIGRASCRE